ncbi:hypothetical protein OEV98_05905 [Caldibacillus lycopersici]|uniref:Uncharacterized protein n=1 Tax=Perspicuibacillus lycopersici TaxID=1325689 RepID=A0AAE3ISZ5_9BACI|nr:hypothetical protein [Perspicuibacillus lycopersici]MCU9613083.1 hypothetical protein [Perspicuibacillus lycopersici]
MQLEKEVSSFCPLEEGEGKPEQVAELVCFFASDSSSHKRYRSIKKYQEVSQLLKRLLGVLKELLGIYILKLTIKKLSLHRKAHEKPSSKEEAATSKKKKAKKKD